MKYIRLYFVWRGVGELSYCNSKESEMFYDFSDIVCTVQLKDKCQIQQILNRSNTFKGGWCFIIIIKFWTCFIIWLHCFICTLGCDLLQSKRYVQDLELYRTLTSVSIKCIVTDTWKLLKYFMTLGIKQFS